MFNPTLYLHNFDVINICFQNIYLFLNLFLVMDQMDLAQVKAAADDFLSKNCQLDGLLLNAGWFGSEYKLSGTV